MNTVRVSGFGIVLLAIAVSCASGQNHTATHLVISEVFTGGGSANSSVLYQRDWVELHNPTAASVSLTGWSLQYKSAAGTGAYAVGALTGAIAPHGYLLIVTGTAGTAGQVLSPAADIDLGTSINMSSSDGRIALCSTTAPITSLSESAQGTLIDLLGYGTAVAFEGAAAASSPGLTFSLERKASAASTSAMLAPGGSEATKGNGEDSNNNANDFVQQASPSPQSSVSPIELLPVELTSFTAVARPGRVELAWTTASEVNNHGFAVERRRMFHSGGEEPWAAIGFVAGAGSTNVAQRYAYSDCVAPGTYAYRLRQIDRDGTSACSRSIDIVVAAVPTRDALEQNYPNPFNGTTQIRFMLHAAEHAALRVYNALGQEVAALFDGEADADVEHSVVFNAEGLPSGMYFYALRTGDRYEVRRMTLMK